MRTSASPSLPPSSRWDLRAVSSSSWVMSFALRRRSPSLTAMGREDAKAGGVNSQQLTVDSTVRGNVLRALLSTVDCRLWTGFLHRLQLPDQGPRLQLRLDLDEKLALIGGQPENQVPAQQVGSFAPGLDPNRVERSRGRDDLFPSLDLDVKRVRFIGENGELDRFLLVELQGAQVVDRGKGIQRRVPQTARGAVDSGHALLVVELRQLVPHTFALDRVLLEPQGAKGFRFDPGDHVVAHEKELGQKVVGKGRQSKLVGGAPVPLSLFGCQRQLPAGDSQNCHGITESFAEERRIGSGLREDRLRREAQESRGGQPDTIALQCGEDCAVRRSFMLPSRTAMSRFDSESPPLARRPRLTKSSHRSASPIRGM